MAKKITDNDLFLKEAKYLEDGYYWNGSYTSYGFDASKAKNMFFIDEENNKKGQ